MGKFQQDFADLRVESGCIFVVIHSQIDTNSVCAWIIEHRELDRKHYIG